MVCLNEAGLVAYSRGEQDSGKHTIVVDLVFVSNVLHDQVEYRILNKVNGFQSDHRISSVEIDLKMDRHTGTRYVWHLTPRKEFEELVEQRLEHIPLEPLTDEHAISKMIHAVIQTALVPAIEELVPVIQTHEPSPSRPSPSSLDRTTRIKQWRQAVEIMACNRRGIFYLAKRADTWGHPRRMAYTPDFQVGSNTYRSNPDKADFFVSSTWTNARKKALPVRTVPVPVPLAAIPIDKVRAT